MTEFPGRQDLERLVADLEPGLDPTDPLFEAGVSLLAEGFAASTPPPWLFDGMFDRVCFKAHLGVAVGLFRVLADEE